jgi:GNAT superfamily N-acetyltransferase
VIIGSVLYEVSQPLPIIRSKAADSLSWRVLGHWLSAESAEGAPVVWLTDDLGKPALLIRLAGASCMALNHHGDMTAGLADLLNGRIEGGSFQPAVNSCFKLGRVDRFVREAALQAGFLDVEDQEQPHYSAHAWYVEGPARFSEHVRHPCRRCEGPELSPLFAEADPDEDVGYIAACLAVGPSFVCEDNVEPVCWSCTHLGGAMGRIFTPPEYRGRGYGKSLTAFQVDHMLASKGIAVASVSIENPASHKLLLALGAHHLPEPLTWSDMRWPSENQ